MGRWPMAGVTLLAACSGSEAPAFLNLGALERELILLASLDEGGATRQTTLFDWSDDAQASLLISVPAGGRLVGVAFDSAPLELQVPRFDPDRKSEFGAEDASPEVNTCTEGVLRSDGRSTQVPWPAEARAFEWLVDDAKRVDRDLATDWWARSSPRVPVHVDQCARHPAPVVRPFSPQQPVLDADTRVNGLPLEVMSIGHGNSEFVRLEERWVLMAYGGYLVLVERDVGFVDLPGRALTADAGWQFRSVAVGPVEAETGRRKIGIVALSGSADREETDSRIFEGWFDGETLELGPVLFETPEIVDSIYLRPDDGRIIAYARPDKIYAESETAAGLTLVGTLPDSREETDKRGRLLTSGIAALPIVLVGSRPNTVYLGSPDGRTWINEQSGLALGLTIRAFEAAQGPDGGFRLYVGDTAGGISTRKLEENTWQRLEPRLDPALIGQDCAVAQPENACGFARPKHSWQHFTAFTDSAGQPAVLAVSDFCSLIFIIRPDGCTSSLHPSALGSVTRRADDEIFAGRREAGFLTLATELGSLYEIEWTELGLGP